MRLRMVVAVVLACTGGTSLAEEPSRFRARRVAFGSQNPWARYTDNTEHAFSIDVPRGWQVQGGIARRSPMQPHVVLTLRSPGGKTTMLLGNAEAFTYAVLTRMSYDLGFREGTLYSPGTDNMLMRNYIQGQKFAVVYGGRFLPKECQNVRSIGSRNRPDKAYRSSAYGLQFSGTAGDAFFTCEKEGHKYEAYVFSVTELSAQPNVPGGIWNADFTYLFATPEGHGAAAGVTLAHILSSFRFDQDWLARQLKVSRDSANKALAEANAKFDANAASMRSTFTGTNRDARASQEEFGRLISGFDEYQTAGGEKKYVPYAAATNWWSNDKGQTLGTQGPLSPGMNMQEMKRVPPGK